MAEASYSLEQEKNFEFTSAHKRKLMMYFGIGAVLFIIGVIILALTGGGGHAEAAEGAAAHGGGHHHYQWWYRVMAVLWQDAVLFTGISLIGVFFVATQYVAYAGWSVGLRRIPEAFGYFLPYMAPILLVIFLVDAFVSHSLFHWTDMSLYDKAGDNYDAIIDGKSGYLNIPFFLIRMVIYFVLWIFLHRLLRNNSLKEDSLKAQDYKGDSIKLYNKNVYMSAVFLVVFAVTSSTAAWDWLMSIDTHWFSTMYGWYVFASWFVSGLAVITLTVVRLKEMGYLNIVTENHLHDLGKFMFAFSIFWTYIWFAQFLLYYYANIPEEGIYYLERLAGMDGHYTGVFFITIIINFAFPFLALMTRASKRKLVFLKIVAIAILVGHWLDFYMMVMPGALKEHGGFGLVEFGALIMFICGFNYVIANNIAKVNIVPKKDPMLKESANHVVV